MDIQQFDSVHAVNISSFNFTEYILFNHNWSNENKHNITKLTTFLCTSNYCLPNALILSIISICGIIGNLVVTYAVISEKRLHTPTFIVISCLALSDLTFLLSRYTRFIVDGYFSTSLTVPEYRIARAVLDFLGLIGAGSSIFHLLYMSFVRYYIIVHPLKAHVKLTSKRVLVISCLLFIGAAAISTLYLFAVVINITAQALRQAVNWTVTILMSFVPIFVIGITHVFKAKALLKSLSTAEETARKMSRVITFVIVCYLITTTPSNVMDIINLLKIFPFTLTFFHLMMAFRILLFLNFAINPFIYFIFSPQFKRFFREKFKNICPSAHGIFSHSEHSNSTRLTEVSHSTHAYNAITKPDTLNKK